MTARYRKTSRAGKSRTSQRSGQAGKSGVRRIRRQAEEQAAEVQIPLSIEALTEFARESLRSFAIEVGLKLAECLLEDEVTRRCGARHERQPTRSETRHGHQAGYVTLSGQKVRLSKPRIRSTRPRQGEAELENYALLQSPDAMPEGNHRRIGMVVGVGSLRGWT